jgi:hypothetical protein
MGCKRLVALQLEVPHHFIKGIACGRARRVEHPGAFGAAPTPETVFVDPNELACRRHYPDVLYHFLVRFYLTMQHHLVHLSGPLHQPRNLLFRYVT